MPFEKYGYLGTQILDKKKENTKENMELFDIGMDTLKLAYDIMYSSNITNDDYKKVIVFALYCKIVESYNSTVLLSNYGLLSDSRSMLRVFIESVFIFSGIINDESLYDQFIIKGDYETYELIKRVNKNPNEYTEELKKYCDNFDCDRLECKVSKYKKENFYARILAEKANMNDVYYYVYHQLCEDVHTNVRSLRSYIDWSNNDIVGLNPLPKYTDQSYVLVTVIWIMLRALKDLDSFAGLATREMINSIEVKLKPHFKTSVNT
jgi:hypothetical protein